MSNLMKTKLFLVAGLLSGCVNPYPQPIVTVTEQEAVKRVNNVRTMNPEWRKANSAGGLNTPYNTADLRLNLKIYVDLYDAQYKGLVRTLNTTDGATVLGGIWGVAGALTGTKAWIYQGAGVAGGSALYSDHYQIKLQSENYYRARNAMHCMYRTISGVPEGNELSAVGIRTVDIAINDINSKLERVQREVVLAEPDLDKLKRSFLLPEPAAAIPGVKVKLTDDQVDKDILPKIEKCVSEF